MIPTTNNIEFKLYREKSQELLRLYKHFQEHFTYEGEHGALLVEHQRDMYSRLFHIVAKLLLRQGNFAKMQMTGSEALAFVQMWSSADLRDWPLANVLVLEMIEKIDRKIAQNRHKQPNY